MRKAALASLSVGLFPRILKASCVLFMTLSGCSAGPYIERLPPLGAPPPPVAQQRHVFLRNYKIGETRKAFIGQPVLRVRDIYYDASDYVPANEYGKTKDGEPINKFVASSDFTIEARHKGFTRHYIWLDGRTGIEYQVVGGVVFGGNRYNLIDIMDRSGYTYSLLIDDKGVLSRNYLLYGDQLMDYSTNPIYVSSDNLHFINKEQRKVRPLLSVENIFSPLWRLRTCGRLNFDLIYGGRNDVSMSFAYREYTSENYARPAFSQSIVYETKANQVRFQNTKIEIVSATNEEITYKVVEDGLANSDLLADDLSEGNLPNPAEVDFDCSKMLR